MDQDEGRAPATALRGAAPPQQGQADDAQAARSRRRIIIAMAAVAGALSVGLALLRVAS